MASGDITRWPGRHRLTVISVLLGCAAAITVGASSRSSLAVFGSLTSIRPPGATVSALAVRTTPANIPTPGAHFATLPPGAPLPSDAACAAAVRRVGEQRHSNDVANQRVGIGPTDLYSGVTGNFTGTTDEIIQWAACKWGIDEDVARAQIAIESYWRMDAGGDVTFDQSRCNHLVQTAPGTQCPESVGLGQVRFPYHSQAFSNDNAVLSSAYNVDYTYAVWRECFNGDDTWLNQFERTGTYAAGDMWGCVGLWFAGRWHTAPADQYIGKVQDYLNRRIWLTPDFQGG